MEKGKGKQKKKKQPLVAVTVSHPKNDENEKKGEKRVPRGRLGYEERQMMLAITGPQKPLNYPMHLLSMSDGTFTKEYEIPEEDREEVFQRLYLFDTPPSMDTVMLDIHDRRWTRSCWIFMKVRSLKSKTSVSSGKMAEILSCLRIIQSVAGLFWTGRKAAP